jgi:phosphoglycolate phosphatase
MRQYRHLFFDFDGVLCDSLQAAMRAFNELRGTFPALPEVASRDDMVTVYGGSLRTCLSAWLGPATHKAFFDAHSAMMMAARHEVCLYPDIDRLLRCLPAKRCSIVTSAYTEHVRALLLACKPPIDPGQFFAIAGREQRRSKADKLRVIVSELELAPEDCVYVGDLESDILYCKELSMDVAVVTYGYHPKWHLEKCAPTFLLDSVEELQSATDAWLS